MNDSRTESYAKNLQPEVKNSVRSASRKFTQLRVDGLAALFSNPLEARTQAAAVKSYVIDHLHDLLIQFEAACMESGMIVHWAKDAASARDQILEICKKRATNGATIVKAKSMATEEIDLNHCLHAAGYDVVETDLGEFVVQLDGDTPSHIVAPIIHRSATHVSNTFHRYGIGPKTEDPRVLTQQARKYLRSKFKKAQVGISGVNFGIAETGRLVLIENEGNNRLSTTAPDTHIAVMGIEKLLPLEGDLPLFLKLLCGSATGQRLSTIVHLISGPRQLGQPDGPTEVHVVLIDNGRSSIANSRFREILRCIRCGACLNICPVYRESSGHAYGHVYSGPIGAILAPLLSGIAPFGDLAKASTLCGACEEACPVRIPIPDMLLEMRHLARTEGVIESEVPWREFAWGASHPTFWRAGLQILPMVDDVQIGPAAAWANYRELPTRDGRAFRRWWRDRS